MLEKYQNKKILITGGLGMIGSSLASRLVSLGAKVTLLDSLLEPYGSNEFNIKGITEEVQIVNADIRDKENLYPVIEGQEIIFNFAGQVSHNDSLQMPTLDAEINYLGHLNVLECVREIDPNIKILYSGTRLQFGRIEKNPVSEDHPLKPLTPYALNKAAAEQMYLYYHRMFQIPVVLFRIANPYGPRGQMRHSKYCIVNWFLRQVMEGKPLTIYGKGTQIRDYIFIDDLVEAFLFAGIEPKTDGEVFNVGSGIGTTFCKMAETILKIVGQGELRFIPWPENYINVETGDYITNISKINQYTDWIPKVLLEEGIQRTYEYYEKHKQFYDGRLYSHV